jgi:hypothetical protein
MMGTPKPGPSVAAESSGNPADSHKTSLAIRSDAQIMAHVRLNLHRFGDFVENDQERWMEGMRLARYVQGVILSKIGISPLRVHPRIFGKVVAEFAAESEFQCDPDELVLYFEKSWPRVLCPDGYTPISYAFELASVDHWRPRIDEPFHTEAMQRDAETTAATSAYLTVFRKREGKKGLEFYLPARTVADYLKRDRMYAWGLLANLVKRGVLTKTGTTTEKRSTLYRYQGELPPRTEDLKDLEETEDQEDPERS